MQQLRLAISNNNTVKVINIVSIIGQNVFCFKFLDSFVFLMFK